LKKKENSKYLIISYLSMLKNYDLNAVPI